ncbi:MAG: methyl-accepting chemotaxis protein, partial [Bacteroidota bacterium]|nr:methyl-accepting chemotaxis protein [Bacteroidota bacterium]
LKEIVEGVNSGAGNIASASNQMSSNSQQLSQGASEQASSVEEVSSSMEEMVSNIQQNTDNAKETEKIANSASQGISEVNKLSNKSLESIRKIADKIGIINDIAFQTNILALNAAVEAARAGEHGKGFAVVASEVRKLAEKSKIAAEDIVNLTKNSVKVTENSGVVLAKVIPDVEKTSNLIQEIAGASMEQKAGSDQINNAIQQLNQVTQQNAASSEELATSSEELLGQSETLKEQINYFQVKKDNYSINKKEQQANDKENHIKNPISIDKKNKEVKSNPKEGIDLKMFDNDNINDDDYEKF